MNEAHGHAAGTGRLLAGFLPMRILILSPLLLLAACDRGTEQKDAGGAPGVVTNIVDQTAPDAGPDAGQVQNGGIETVEQAPGTDQAGDGTPSEGMPLALQGSWAGAKERCGDRAAPLELTINATSLIFHESVGTVKRIERAADGGLAVEASFTGEGESWTRKLHLTPSSDGDRLTIVNDGTAVTRKRC